MARRCAKCGRLELKSREPNVYHYRLSGLDNVYLTGGVTEYICPKCGAKSTSIKNVTGLHKAIAGSIATAKRRLGGKELRFLREEMGFSAEELAKVVEYSEEHIRKIESDVHIPKATYEMFLRMAILREMQAPGYDLRELGERKEYALEELNFVNKDHIWTKMAA